MSDNLATSEINTNTRIKKIYKCKICNKEFDQPIDLGRHIRLFHKSSRKDKENNKIKGVIKMSEINKDQVDLMIEKLKFETEKNFASKKDVDEIKTSLDTLYKNISALQIPQQSTKDIDDIKTSLNTLHKTIPKQQELKDYFPVDQLIKSNQAISTDIKSLQEQITQVSNKTENLCQQFPQLCRQIEELKKQQEVKKSASEFKDLVKEREKEINKLSLSLSSSSVCPHCNKEIPHSIQGHTGKTTRDVIQAIQDCPECKSGLEKFATEYILDNPEVFKKILERKGLIVQRPVFSFSR